MHEKYDAAHSNKHENHFGQEAIDQFGSVQTGNQIYPAVRSNLSETSEQSQLAYNQYYNNPASHYNYSYWK